MKIDPFVARHTADDVLPDHVIQRLTGAPTRERIDPSLLSRRGRELVETLRLLNPLADATLAGDQTAAGALAALLNVPHAGGTRKTLTSETIALLGILDGFVPRNPECESAMRGRVSVLKAAFQLDREAGNKRAQYMRNAHLLMLSARDEVNRLAKANLLTSASERRNRVQRARERDRAMRVRMRSRPDPGGFGGDFGPVPGGLGPGDGPPPEPPLGPLPDPLEPTPPLPDLCADLSDLCTAVMVERASQLLGNPYGHVINGVEPDCLRAAQLPTQIWLRAVAGVQFPPENEVDLIYRGQPVAAANIVHWGLSEIRVTIPAGAQTGGFSIQPKIWRRQAGSTSADALPRVCGLAFPDLSSDVLEDPDVTLHILYPPELTATVDGRADDPVAVIDCTPVRVSWQITFPNQPPGWRVPACVGVTVALQAPDRQVSQSPSPAGTVDLKPETSAGEIIIRVRTEVDAVLLGELNRTVRLQRTRPIRITGQQKLLVGRSGTLTVRIPCNAPDPGLSLNVVTDPAGVILHPARITVPPAFTTVTLDISAEPNARQGNVTLRMSDPAGGHDDGLIVVEVRQPVAAVALSGGGAKGSFEVGAFSYLATRWDELNVRSVCAISVGSINALAVAEDRGLQSALKIQDIWLQLRQNTDMYQEEEWTRQVKERIAAAFAPAGAQAPIDPDLVRAANLADLIFPPDPDDNVCRPRPGGPRISGGWDWSELLDVIKWIYWPVGIVSEIVEAGAEKVVAASILEDLARTIQFLDESLNNRPELALFNLGPVRAKLQVALDADRLTRAPLQMRLGSIDVETGELLWVTEQGDAVIGRNANGPVRQTRGELLTQKLIDGALASSAIPGVFTAITIDEVDGTAHLCVDGGLRDVLPVRAAFDLGADTVYAIATGGVGMTRVEVTSPLEVVFRSLTEISGDEIGVGDRSDYIAYGPLVRQILIEPGFAVHATTQIDPGLLRINIAYGYMRAFDELFIDKHSVAPDDAARIRQMTDSIVRLRREIWRLENALFCSDFNSEREVQILADIRSRKGYLLVLLDIRVGSWGIESVPRRLGTPGQRWSERLEDWWERWEQHLDHITSRQPTPWDPHQIPTGRESAPVRPAVPPTLQAAL